MDSKDMGIDDVLDEDNLDRLHVRSVTVEKVPNFSTDINNSVAML